MGLPEILIEFKKKAETAVIRSRNGVVAAILLDTTKSGDGNLSYKYNFEADIPKEDWSEKNLDYINKIFMGSPRRVIVERVQSEDEYDDALARLKNKQWNWLTVPEIADEKVESIKTWIVAQRAAKKIFKAVLPSSETASNFNDEGIVEFATGGIKVGTKSYTTAEYCARIAGLLAGLPMTESATYHVLAEVDGITESITPDNDIDAGKFILVDDGEKIKVGRGINSLHIISGDKTEDMKKIKIIEGMDLMRDDIRKTFEENYVGVNNSYDNKILFIAAINNYFDILRDDGVLYDEFDNSADIDIAAQRKWLSEHSVDVSEMSDEQIRAARTGSYVFVQANVQFSDALEDLHFVINME